MENKDQQYISVKKARLEILTIVKNDGHSVDMDDRWTYLHPDFLSGKVGDKYAVLREMDSPFSSGLIVKVLKI